MKLLNNIKLPNLSRNKIIIIVIVIIFLIVVLIPKSRDKDIDKLSAKDDSRSTDIKVEVVDRGVVKEINIVPGVAEAWETVPVAIETNGLVNKVYVEEGDTVKIGATLLTLDTEELKANLASSSIQLKSSKTDFDRAKNLYAGNAVSQKSYDDAFNAFKIAEASYRVAKEQESKSVLKSPVSGVVDIMTPKAGEFINAGYVVANIVVLDKLKIYLDVSEQDIQFLNVGDNVSVYPADGSGKDNIVTGQINYISVSADPQTLTYKVRVDLENAQTIRPGRIVRAEITQRILEDSIAVNFYSIVSRSGKNYVFINDNGTAVEKEVVLGPMINDRAIILSGLNDGDELIVSGQQFLSNKSNVKVVE